MYNKTVIVPVILLLAAIGPRLHATTAAAQPAVPDILVVRDGWQADRDTVRKVLESTARELWKHFPDRKLPPIIVSAKGGPISIYRRGPGGEIFIRLDTGQTYWAQYAFQFGHELCHVLCNFDADDHGNDWFEESLCEMASLFVLRRMGETWKTAPPFGHWKNFAPNLTGYAESRIKACRLAEGETLAGWYAKHANQLHASATKRDLNRVVAAALLPIFEETPEHWAAVTHLNDGNPDKPQTFAEFVADWHKHSPKIHRPFIKKIAAEFGLTMPRP